MKTPHKDAEWIKLWADGEQLEYRGKKGNKWDNNWTTVDKNSFMFSSVHSDFEFRIKPESEYIPFDFSHADELLGKKIVSKKLGKGNMFLITGIRLDGIGTGGGGMTFKELLDSFTFEDGSPCGILKPKSEKEPEIQSQNPKSASIDLFQLKTFKDVCEFAGKNPGSYSLPKNPTDEQIKVNTLRKLELIYSVFNQGWKADWKNSSELKYYPWFTYSDDSGFSYYVYGYVHSNTHVGVRLYTNTKAKAEYIGKTFIDIYRDFLG